MSNIWHIIIFFLLGLKAVSLREIKNMISKPFYTSYRSVIQNKNKFYFRNKQSLCIWVRFVQFLTTSKKHDIKYCIH